MFYSKQTKLAKNDPMQYLSQNGKKAAFTAALLKSILLYSGMTLNHEKFQQYRRSWLLHHYEIL